MESLPSYTSQPQLPRYATLPPESPLMVSHWSPTAPSYPPYYPREPTKKPGLYARLRSLVSHMFYDIWRSDNTWLVLTFVLFIGFNAVDVVVIYFFIRTSVHPYPRSGVNLTHAGFETYKVFMYMFGAFVGLINYVPVEMYWKWYLSNRSTHRRWLSNVVGWFHGLVVVPASIIVVFGPSFSPMLGLFITQTLAWNHGCDNFPTEIILYARGYNDPSYYPSTAQFLQRKSPTYTYDIFQSSADGWSFNLRSLDMAGLNPFAPEYPSISNVTFDFRDNSVSGDCTSPASNTTTRCIAGSFNPDSYLTFNLNDLRTNATYNLRAVDKQWEFNNDAPSVTLKDDNDTDIIRTDVTNYRHCNQLKVCAASGAGPEIIVPAALILISQTNFAIVCTTHGFINDDSV